MAFVTSVNWPGVTKEIVIARASMPVIQVSPEIRRLDTDTLWLELKDLEKSAQGMLWPNIQTNNPLYTISGINYAQGWLIQAPYFITFEDGQYAVSLVNTNNNILDVATQNQVRIASSNSAGLQQVVSGSGVTQQDKDDIEAQIFAHLIGTWSFEVLQEQLRSNACAKIIVQEDGKYVVRNVEDTKDRMSGEPGANGGRQNITYDQT